MCSEEEEYIEEHLHEICAEFDCSVENFDSSLEDCEPETEENYDED